jgi:hypothetical protein
MEIIANPNHGLVGAYPNALLASSDVLLTDAAPTQTAIVYSGLSRDLLVDLAADKGCTVVITPLLDNEDDSALDNEDDSALGKPGDTGTLADGGGAERFLYESIGAARAKIVITKTEAGDATATLIVVRGLA